MKDLFEDIKRKIDASEKHHKKKADVIKINPQLHEKLIRNNLFINVEPTTIFGIPFEVDEDVVFICVCYKLKGGE